MTLEEILVSLLNLGALRSPARDSVTLSADANISGAVQGDVLLETKELPAGEYSVSFGVRAITDEGWVAHKLDRNDVNGRVCQVYTHDKTTTDACPMPSATRLVRLDTPGTIKLQYEAGENPQSVTAKETFLTAVRVAD